MWAGPVPPAIFRPGQQGCGEGRTGRCGQQGFWGSKNATSNLASQVLHEVYLSRGGLLGEKFFFEIHVLLFIYLFMTVLSLRFCARAFSSCGKWGPPFIAVHGPLTIVASLVAEHRLQMRRLSNCGSWAQLLHGMWDPPRPGLEPVSPALAGRLSTTAPPGKPKEKIFLLNIFGT